MVYVDKLKKFRKEIEMTQQQLGDKLGVARTLITQMETGSMKPNIKFLNKLAKYSGKSVGFWIDESFDRIYKTYDDLDILLNTLVNAGMVKEDGKIDETCAKLVMTILEKEIRIKMEYRDEDIG
jgi:transcriptional regulator with XRE-family HTH domain